MRVCLINPPSAFLLDERVFVSLGILRVAAVLDDVEHLDLNGDAGFAATVAKHATASKATVFGITATTPQMPAVVAIIETLRWARPDAKIILGGPHVTLCNAAAKRGVERGKRAVEALLGLADVLVCGDGEKAIHVALQPGSPPIVDADDPKSPLFMAAQDELPIARRDLVDLSTYRYSIDGVRATSMIAQLGCPFECAFCGGRFSPSLRRIRTRSTEAVVREVEHIKALGFGGVMMYDDELNVNKQLVPLMRAIEPLKMRLRGFIKAELFTDEQAEAMARAGFAWILVGFESGSPRILTNINKKATREDNTRCLRIARKHGLKVKALMSIGHAGESRDTIAETREWLAAEEPDEFDCTIISTYPGTPYFDEAVRTERGWTYTAPKTGDRLHARDVDFLTSVEAYKGIPGRYTAHVHTDYLSEEEIVAVRDEIQPTPGVKYEASMGCA